MALSSYSSLARIVFGFLLLVSACLRLPGQDLVRINEFAAVNAGPFADEDGDFSDWIELYNAGMNTVDLTGWYLTDAASNLKKWKFPATNLPPNAYLVVFASGKDRQVPGAPLHTSFKLDAAGEYLGLVKPDGLTVVSSYSPAYPPQVAHVSYGIPLQQGTTTLVASGADARVYVPTDDTLGYSWTGLNFNDSAWLGVRTGVGYEKEGQGVFVPVKLADSVADFSGTQGSNNWFYGYWDKGADADGVYSDAEFTPFPNAEGPYSGTNFWDGTSWHWYQGDPPWTRLTADGGHPSANDGNASLPDHWAIRRWVSKAEGLVKISGRVEHQSGWVYVTATGTAANSLLYIYLTAAGDGYIDDMKLVAGSTPEVGSNLLPDGGFESAFPGLWTVSANLSASVLSTAVKHSGNASLHVIASAGGSTQASAIWQTISPALTSGQTYTLSYWFLPGTAIAPMVVRFSGSWITTTPAYCGDGVVGRVFVDGTQVLQKAAFVNGSDYAVTVPVQVGSHIDLALDPASSDYCDSSTFTAAIETADAGDVVVADSVADWSLTGTQGERNWYYGYYNRSTDADGVYQATDFIAFPRDNGPPSASNFWTGTGWDWFNGNPPWDEMFQTAEHPNGVNSSQEHWVIRRWVGQVSGRLTVDWTLAKANPAGNGVTGHLFHNGVQKDVAMIAGTDSVGVARNVVITNAQIGDVFDLALDPTGVGGATDDGSDGSTMTMVIRGRPSLSSGIATDISAAMQNVNASAYLRIPFVVADPSAIQFLTLKMKYDDGFLAYLNGVGVAARNAPVAPDVPAWNSTATADRPDVEAVQFQSFDLTPVVGLLQPGTNLLAIHGLNISAADLDFLILPELVGAGVAVESTNRLYFANPSPGAPNGLGSSNLGPLVVNAAHTPSEPKDNEDLYVTAQVIQTFNPISHVTLTYRVMFSNEVTVPMFDDGLHADGVAGDGVWGGIIPASAASPGQMVRYFVFATDTQGNGMRLPLFATADAPQYQGTVVFNPALTNPLPVLHWFIQNPSGADSDVGAACSIYFNGQFRDNAHADLHGQSARGFPKHSYDIALAPGDKMHWDPAQPAIDSINLLSTFADKTQMRNMLAYGSYADANAPHHYAFPVRVQQNNAFHSVADWVENGDANYLKRLGLDPNGALYKMYNGFNTIGSTVIQANTQAEKKTRKNEDNADLVALFNGVSQAGQPLINYVFDNIDIPASISLLAGHVLNNDEDCCHKNYYLYRDTEGTGEWMMTPWDVDLSFGHTWTDDANHYNYYDPRIYATNCYSSSTSLGIGGGNNFAQALFNIPWVYQMYLRRVRTITDEQFQPPETHPYLLHYEGKANALAAQIAPDAALDFTKWIVPNWATFPPTQSLAQAVGELKDRYFAPRRKWIYTTLVANGSYIAPQPTNATVLIGTIEYDPASHNQAQEYIQLLNRNTYPVDISGWHLTGAIDYTFKGGVVIPTNGVLYLSPNVNAFRARTSGPHGGQGLFVQGNYQGQLSARGELVQLVDKTGRVVQSTNYPGTPSLAQQYLRITEIMYHPASRPGLATNADEFEYLELKNIGPAPLSLLGVHFTNGVDFAFTPASAITSLGAGESVLLVKNLTAFTSRYGSGLRIGGEYAGALNNAGENLRLDDASGEKILDFSYDNKWYPITDGFGFSLVVVNENAPWDAWGLMTNWRPSGQMGGSPGADDPAPPSVAPILVNELLSHTDLPQTDAVELFNPTTNDVNIGGWFLTDDYTNAFKFRIPNGTILPAGCYVVFTETNFNLGGTGFAFSSKGDEVYLLSGDANTNLTGYIHGFNFGAAANGVTFGRYVTSQGRELFVAQGRNSLGTNNAGPLVGPLVISEIMYHPPDLPDGSDNQLDEFIEIRNTATTNVALFDPAVPANTWHLRGGVDFNFPPALTLAPGGHLLVVSFDTTNTPQVAAFRSKYGVPTDVTVFGPYAGKLDNSADTVRLYKPDAPDLDGTVPYILVDEVQYQDLAPWPGEADGTGASLQRISLSQYGNDPINWTAGAPGAGLDFAVGTPPTITTQPAPQSVAAFSPVTFGVGVSDTASLSYQWRRNGVNIPGATNAQYTFSPEPLADAFFSVAVFNPAGAVLSSNVALKVFIPVVVTAPPEDRVVFPMNTNITLTVAAASAAPPLRYQWRHDGVPISIATNSSYTIQTVQPADDGLYDVVLTDNAAPVTSPPARLTVVLHPLFVTQPTSRAVGIGATAVNTTFSCVATSGTPVRLQWLFNGNTITNATNATFTITNVQASHTGDYAVVATDSYGPFSSSNATLLVVVKPAFLPQPASQTVAVGQLVTIKAEWTGTPPFGYRWRTNTVGPTVLNLVPSNTISLVFPSVALSNAAGYEIIVTNLGSGTSGVRSSNAFLSVVVPPASQTAAPGASPRLRAILANPPAFTNRVWWLFNATNVLWTATNASPAGKTNLFTNDLVVTNFSADRAGLYSFLVSNAAVVANFAATLQLDTDQDGIPDAWEDAYGLNKNDPSDAATDKDGDGMSNLDEYLAGTDPTDPRSYLRLQADQAIPGGIVLEFYAVSNRAYAIYWLNGLTNSSWTKLTDIQAGPVSQTIQVTNAAPGASERYYRLVIPPSP
jgi:hypothetical protein